MNQPLENRLVMKLMAKAIEAQAAAIEKVQKLEQRIANQREQHVKDHIQILAYRSMIGKMNALNPEFSQDERDQMWVEAVQEAVAHLRAKGQTIPKTCIPRLKSGEEIPEMETLEIHVEDVVERPIVREVSTSPLADFPEDVWHAFHRVWTFAVGKVGYDKEAFRLMEAELLRMHREGDGPPTVAATVVRLTREQILARVREVQAWTDRGESFYSGEIFGRSAEMLERIGMDVQQFRALEVESALQDDKAAG